WSRSARRKIRRSRSATCSAACPAAVADVADEVRPRGQPMAEAAAQPADPLAGLIDIPLPPPVSLLPQTWPSRIALVLLAVGLIPRVWWLVRSWRANRYRRAALAELNDIAYAPVQGQTTSALALLVRRTALAAFPRQEIAALTGRAWLAFL